jgi:predicted protein tyrosine phosphatase
MKIEIESRESITNRAMESFPMNTALISITGTINSDEFVELNNQPDYLLQLRFCDVFGKAHRGAISDEQAMKIAAFIKSIQDKAEILICQCEFGVSRSAGVAAAVRQFLYEDGIQVFADSRYSPNKLVYHKVYNALKIRAFV